MHRVVPVLRLALAKGIAEGADGRIYVYEHSTQDIRVTDDDDVPQVGRLTIERGG